MMKTIVTADGCVHVPMSADEISERQAEIDAFNKQLPRLETIKAIKALEAQQTPRRLREAVLGTDDGWLISLDEQIEKLRSQL